jgi:hypothetical protein
MYWEGIPAWLRPEERRVVFENSTPLTSGLEKL